MLIQSDCYGVYKMNGVYLGELIGVYDVTDPCDALDECINELGLAENSEELIYIEMTQDKRWKKDMTNDEYDNLYDEISNDVYDRFGIMPMTYKK